MPDVARDDERAPALRVGLPMPRVCNTLGVCAGANGSVQDAHQVSTHVLVSLGWRLRQTAPARRELVALRETLLGGLTEGHEPLQSRRPGRVSQGVERDMISRTLYCHA